MTSTLQKTVIVVLSVFWTFNVIISALAGATEGVIFKHRTGDVSNNHTTQVTPAGYTFSIWSLIFIWILCGCIFLLVAIFRTFKDDSAVQPFTAPIMFTMLVNCVCFTSWLFVWDNYYMTASAAILFAIMGTNWISTAIFTYNLYVRRNKIRDTSRISLWCYRIFILNSLGVYTAWTTVAALLNLTIAMVYDGDVKDSTASLICLTLLTVIVFIWFGLDCFAFEKYTRLMITPPFVFVWAVVGIFRKQEISGDSVEPAVKYFTAGLMGVFATLLIARLCFTVFNIIKRPSSTSP